MKLLRNKIGMYLHAACDTHLTWVSQEDCAFARTFGLAEILRWQSIFQQWAGQDLEIVDQLDGRIGLNDKELSRITA